ncbi:MAG: hypothetical protein HC859_11590 [Bacteroidia bacterium]|nr:hypothetical protein [Bacteroidia bacterium]
MPLPERLIVDLIEVELKIRRILKCLNNIGIDEFYLQPSLDNILLNTLGCDRAGDDAIAEYLATMSAACDKMSLDQSTNALAKQVFARLNRIRRNQVGEG